MPVEIWWVESWDDESDEALGEARSLKLFAPTPAEGVALCEKVRGYAQAQYGRGELVLLDANGRRCAGRIPVAELLGAAA